MTEVIHQITKPNQDVIKWLIKYPKATPWDTLITLDLKKEEDLSTSDPLQIVQDIMYIVA